MTSCKTALLSAVLLLATIPLVLAQSNPVPLINNPLVPDSVVPGGPSFTLTVNGTGFVSGSTVNWNSTPLTTTFVSASQLTASVPASSIKTANVANITVVSPAPGGGISNAGLFQASYPTTTVGVVDVDVPSVSDAYATATADFNGDGRPDIASTVLNGSADGSVQILINNGDGTFQTSVQYPTQITPVTVVIADFNGDGKLDLAISNECGSDTSCQTTGTVSILLGNGDGTFAPAANYNTVLYANTVIAADFNGDGKLDLAVSGAGVSVLLGNGDGTFQSAVLQGGALINESVAAGDMDGNGTIDLVFSYAPNFDVDGSLGVMLGNGDGTFQPAVYYPTLVGPWDVVLADFNQDGKLDAAVADYSPDIQVFLGKGDGTLLPAVSYAGGAAGLFGVDFNSDAKLDLITGASLEDFFAGNGDGTFQPYTSFGGSYGSQQLGFADFNGDGKVDIVGRAPSPYEVDVQFQNTAINSPASLSFPDTLVGQQSGPLTVTLINTANALLPITSIAITGTQSSDFSQTNSCGTSLPSGQTCTIKVQFMPSTDSFLGASLVITDSALNSPQTVSLEGVGTYAKLTPPNLDFGDVPLRTTSAPQLITLTNTGTKKFGLYGNNTLPSDREKHEFVVSSTTCGALLHPGQSCTFTLTFTPHLHGLRTSTFQERDNGSLLLETQTVGLKGRGTSDSAVGDPKVLPPAAASEKK